MDFDTITDDDIDSILNQISNGEEVKFTATATETETNTEAGSEENEDNTEVNSETNVEDTDHTEGDENEADTDNQGDGQDAGTDGVETATNGETTQTEQKDEDKGTETDSTTAAATTETGTIDPSEFERYKKFYEEIAQAEFVANGKTVKGFTDPKKLIQAQQMSYGYSAKMAEIKKYRPFLTALREKGILDDSDKFNFAMSLIDGDKGAIKTHIGKHKINAMDLELDEVEYKPTKNYVANNASLILDEVFENARTLGIDTKLRETLSEQWDEASFKEFIEEPETRSDLIEHMQNGVYDTVMDRLAELESIDVSGKLSGMKTTDKYRYALRDLHAEYERSMAAQQVQATPQVATTAPKAEPQVQAKAELDEATKKRLEDEYRAKVEQKNLEAAEARKKAAAISKKKVVTSTQTKVFDPLALEDDDLDTFVNSLINNGRK